MKLDYAEPHRRAELGGRVSRENERDAMVQGFRPQFTVRDSRASASRAVGTFTLIRDMWDDFSFKTLFDLWYTVSEDNAIRVGSVKIGFAGQGKSRTELPDKFSKLDGTFFSLGQEREYYERLQSIGVEKSDAVLASLGDVAKDSVRLSLFHEEAVMQRSLLRHISDETVLNQFSRIASGGTILTNYDFEYRFGRGRPQGETVISFEVQPGSMPPSNMHVLIGSNGAGKTTLLNQMARSAASPATRDDERDQLKMNTGSDEARDFAGIVAVSFSAFDNFAEIEASGDMQYSYVGLKAGEAGERAKSPAELNDDFVDSLRRCARADRRARWIRAISTLASDPLLNDSGIPELLLTNNSRFDASNARKTFNALSSGHKIVVLTITRLVELVEEKTLVLLDEPEAHLHPPLLSSMVRALSDLLEDRNGVAIVATHSPVILQEVPTQCVWILDRAGRLLKARRPRQETFGEGVGELTSEVFGLEVTDTGFHDMLRKALLKASGSYEIALAAFDGKLGAEARSILLTLAEHEEG